MRKGNKKQIKDKKPKFKPGGLFKPSEQLGQGSKAAGMLGASIDPLFEDTNVAGKAGTGLLKGAAAGAAFGPVGAVGGALIGGVTGVIGAKKAQKDEEEAKRQQRELMGNVNLNQAFENAGNQFKDGGRILAKKLNPVQGGSLNAISDNAVEVKANNPNASDSVELGEAFVDHNEVIDRKNRVYSDSVFLPNGKSIAKEAKKLEKMKAEDVDKRFASANKYIESKLDKLFEYQESTKKQPASTFFKKGGKITMSKGEFMEEHDRLLDVLEHGSKKQLHAEHERQEKEVKQYKQKGGKLKPAYELGDKLKMPATFGEQVDNMTNFAPTGVNKDGKSFTWSAEDSTSKTPKFLNGDNLQKLATTAATFGPNIATNALIKKLKGPRSPFLEQSVSLKRISPDAQLAAASQQTRQAQEIVRKSTAQGSDAVSAQGSLLARRLNANNEIYGAANNANAQIQAQEAGLNQSVRARNVERTNQFRDNSVDFNNKVQSLKSDNVANLSTKVLQLGRERNQMKLDSERFAWTAKQFEDSNVLSRAAKDPQLLESINANQKKLGLPLYEVGSDGILKLKSKLGGRLATKLTKKK